MRFFVPGVIAIVAGGAGLVSRDSRKKTPQNPDQDSRLSRELVLAMSGDACAAREWHSSWAGFCYHDVVVGC